MATLFKLRSEPDTPTFPSITNVPAESTTLNQVAVPVALAEVSEMIIFAVRTWLVFTKLGFPVEAKVSSERRVVAAPPVAGRVLS